MSQKFQKIVLTADKTELNPLLEPDVKARLQVYGIISSGEQVPVDPKQIRWNVRTLFTSGEDQVISVDETGTVTPLNGGYACVEAAYVGVGVGLCASLKIVVRPFFHEYHKTLTIKLFMAMEPRSTLKYHACEGRDEYSFITFEEALDIIRRLDMITYGMPKIVYLTGWQRGGHDHGYPSLREVNPKLKREEDASAADSLRWLIRESRKYNTAVSLHINLFNAWSDSPLWDEYKENRLFSEKEHIFLSDGEQTVYAAPVSQKRLWDTGFFHKRIAELTEMLPELIDSHTIHIDCWVAKASDELGISAEEEEDAIRKMFAYLRDVGLDCTSEGSEWGRRQPMTGLQPMAYWTPAYDPSVMPPSLYCGGRISRLDGDPRFGDSMHAEGIVRTNLIRGRDPLCGILDEFCMYTLPWRFLNQFRLESFDGDTAIYSGGVRAFIENGNPVILWNDSQIRRGTTFSVPVVWKEDREIILYSFRETHFSIILPPGWSGVTSVDIYYMDPLGKEEPKPEIISYPIQNGRLEISGDTRVLYPSPMLTPRTMYLMKPHHAV
ncbi:MAG: hypothetical protein K6D94_12695 [Clostridiales bacterium]|nr:hypothetical protein [Clostridiales bacterium]